MSFDTHEDQSLNPDVPIVVVIETSCGDIEVELDPGIAPLTVNSFVFLAEQGFFDGSVSHRVMPGFMFQAGDPTATGVGDAGYDIAEDEFPSPGFRYARGVVAMANAGPGTTGSQFFIMLGDSGLAPNYTVIGRVTAGDEVLDAIASIPIASNSRGEVSVPLEALYIERVRVAASP
jgi:cyclophilin family peptidyl-prolyl cis-trans isomerase